MKRIIYTIKVQGLDRPSGEIGPEELRDLREAVPEQEPFADVTLDTRCEREWSAGPALQALWGRWPGDEPMEDLLQMLREAG